MIEEEIKGNIDTIIGYEYKDDESSSKTIGTNIIIDDFSEEIPEEIIKEEKVNEEKEPLSSRIVSKAWRTRSKSYEDLFFALKNDPNGPYLEYSNGLVDYISDPHQVAQEKGLKLLSIYIQNQPTLILASSKELVQALIKCITSSKASIKKESSELILDLFSIQKDNFEDFFVGLKASLNNKNPKIQIGTISVINSIISSFGIDKFPYKDFLLIIEDFASSANPQIRGEAMNFYKEIHKWVKDEIMPALEKLKKGQKDELFKEFANNKDTPIPTRCLKYQNSAPNNELPIREINKIDDNYEEFTSSTEEKSIPSKERSDHIRKTIPEKNIIESKDSRLKSSNHRRNLTTFSEFSSVEKIKSSPMVFLHIVTNAHESKVKRLETEEKCKWSVENIIPAYRETLKRQMKECFTRDLYDLMFNKDYQKQVEGLEYICKAINEQIQDIIEILDILFKWAWIVLQEANKTKHVKGILTMLDILTSKLQTKNYRLHDTEANLLVPILCEKSGNNNSEIQKLIQATMHKISTIYPPTKVFAMLLNGCNSKNAKSIIECLKEMTNLIKEHGKNIIFHAEDINKIIVLIDKATPIVKLQAVSLIGEIYKFYGPEIWDMIGEISDKSKEFIEQRIKTILKLPLRNRQRQGSISLAVSPKNKSFEPSFIDMRSETPPNYQECSFEYQKFLFDSTSKQIDTRKNKSPLDIKGIKPSFSTYLDDENIMIDEVLDVNDRYNKDIFDLNEDLIRYFLNETNFNQGIHRCESPILDQLENSDGVLTEKIIDPAIELNKSIEKLTNIDINSKMSALLILNNIILNHLKVYEDKLIKKAAELIDALVKTIITIFDTRSLIEIPLPFTSFFATIFHKVCSTKIIIENLNEFSLSFLIEQTLKTLTINGLENLGENNEGLLIIKLFHDSILRILEYSQPTLILLVLISLLTKCKSENVIELINKCLLKIIKSMKNSINQIEIEKVFIGINRHLLKSLSFRHNFISIKSIKMIVTELVKLKGPNIWLSYEDANKQLPLKGDIKKWIDDTIQDIYHDDSKMPQKIWLAGYELGMISIMILQDYNTGFQQLQNFIENNPMTDAKLFINKLPEKLQQRVLNDINESNQKKNKNTINTVAGFNFIEFEERLALMKEKYKINKRDNQDKQVLYYNSRNRDDDLI